MALINAGEPKINLRSISDVYEDSKVPIVILDPAFEPVYWNKSGASRFALLIMKNFVKLNLEEDEKQTVRETLREAAFAGSNRRRQHCLTLSFSQPYLTGTETGFLFTKCRSKRRILPRIF